MAQRPIKFGIAIDAKTQGEESIEQLQDRLDTLAASLGGELGQAASAAAARLREVTEQQAAIKTFESLRASVRDTGAQLKIAEQEAASFAQQITATGAPTQLQTQHLQGLERATEAVRERLQAQQQAMGAAESQLSNYGVSAKVTGAAQARLRGDIETLRGALQSTAQATAAAKKSTDELGPALDLAFRTLGVRAVSSVQKEVAGLQAALAQIRSAPDVLPADKARAVEAFNQRLSQLRDQAGKTPPALRAIEPAATSVGSSLATAAHKAVAWTAALAGIGGASDLLGNLVATGSEFETLRGRLESLLGSTEKASAAFSMIKQLAATTPFEVGAMTEAFVKLTAFGMQPSEQQMRALADTAATLGGGTEVLTGVTLALGQAWAKGKLQGEEILQLAERGVPVWDALSRATGRSVTELQRLSSEGKLGREVISALIDELGRMNAGASDKLMATFAGAVSNAKDALDEFFDLVAQSGLLDFLTQKVQELLTEFNRLKDSGELEQMAKRLSDAFISLAGVVEVAVRAVVLLEPALKGLGAVWLGLKAEKWAGAFISLAGSLRGVVPAAVQAGGALTAAAGAAGSAGAATATAATMAGRLFSALKLLRGLSIVGLAMGAVEIATEFFAAKRAIEDTDALLRDAMSSPPPKNEPAGAATQIKEAMDAAGQATSAARAEFDQLISKGQSADQAIQQIGKGFDLRNEDGIRQAGEVLDQLAKDGKISAEQMRLGWEAALNGIDLRTFAFKAEQAFGGAEKDADKLGTALDARLREAIRRTGGEWDVLSGGLSAATQESLATLDTLIEGLDRLKAQGIDTGAALSAGLSNAIKQADSEQALEQIRLRVAKLRQELGDKVADGLLQQAAKQAEVLKAKMDEAKPGINSVAEAMNVLGVTSQKSMDETAAKFSAAYQVMRDSGTATARELRDAFIKYAEAAIKANGGVVSDALKVEAAMRGVEIAADGSCRAMKDGYEGARRAVRDTTEAIDDQVLALERENEAIERANEARDKAVQLERERLNVDAEGFTKDSAGNRQSIMVPTRRSVFEEAKRQGVAEAQAARIASTFINDQGQAVNFQQHGNSLGEAVQKAIDQAVLGQASRPPTDGGGTGGGAGGGTGGGNRTPVIINLPWGGSRTVNVASPSDASTLSSLLAELADAYKRAGGGGG